MSSEQVQAATPASTSTATVNASDPTVAAGAVSSNGEANSATTINSLADLKKKAPKVYNMMMQGIAYGMIQKMQHDQEHLTQIMKEAERNNS